MEAIKQALGQLEQRVAALEQNQAPRQCAAQLVIWDKEYDRLIHCIQKHRESWSKPNPTQKEELRKMIARRDSLRKLLNVHY